jgi:uncharacterized protein (TIGR02996 family)
MTEDDFLQAVRADPADLTVWPALADWLEENCQSDRAELLRLRELLRSPHVPDRAAHEARQRRLLARGVRPVTAPWVAPLAPDVGLRLELVVPGAFLMGSPGEEEHRHSNEGPRHPVVVSRPFWAGAFPVTQGQWQALMGKNPSKHPGPAHPVDSVNWPECQAFCRKLSDRLGRPCRLPTEAEWEYACRAGTTTAYHTGDGGAALERAGWCSCRGSTGSAGGSVMVGQYLPNAFGLYDTHGNVREWCLDALRTYTSQPQVDPRGAEDCNQRAVRGGSWYYGAEDSRSACRYNRPTDYHLDYYGFRVVAPCG